MSSQLKILIADDHPIFRKGLCEVLCAEPSLQLAAQCGDGEEAVRQIERLQPALAILDVHMPRLSGLQAARRLLEKRCAVKIMLLTMHAEEDLLNEALSLGVSGYVLKENAVEELLNAVRCVMAGNIFVSPTLSGMLLRRRAEGETLRREKPGLDHLTPTERRILRHIAEDRTSKEIAELLGCAVRTVDTHRQNISTKLNLSGSHSLLKFAFDNKARLAPPAGA